MTFDFCDKTAIVIGAASGIGAAIAQDLARYGARVALADMDKAGWRPPPNRSRHQGAAPFNRKTDTSIAADVEGLVTFAVAQTGVRVNAVGPGLIATRLLESLYAAATDGIAALHPFGLTRQHGCQR